MLMVKASPLDISIGIRTISAGKLQRDVSLSRMHHSLIDLFVDRTAINSEINLIGNDRMLENLRFMHCQSLNDERTIAFHQGWKQADDVFDEQRQIWIPNSVDVEKDNMFVPRDDAND